MGRGAVGVVGVGAVVTGAAVVVLAGEGVEGWSAAQEVTV